MIASSFFDPMLGVDIHWEMVPTPAPVPTPIPNPFTGIVKDFTGLAAGLALSNAIGAVMGASPKGPVLYWGAIPATNTGTNGEHVPGHILIPPGTAWAPVPKTPKPVVRPNETPKPPKPVSPDNDAIIVFGSKTVTVMGSNAVRLGDIALSCSEPVRLPSTVVLAVPKGAPILIGGPPSLDIMAAIMASLRTRFIGDSLQALLSRLRPSRFRSLLQRGACFLTGHPVDVATGKMVTSQVDAELPGPLPLRIERIYQSNFASRRGPLGYGWGLSLDQAVWEEPGKVVLLAEDGREIEFDTFDFPDHRMRPGDELRHPIDRLTLKCEPEGRWSVTAHDGVRREFATAPVETGGRARLRRTVSRCGYHQVVYSYDGAGQLTEVRDSAGRRILLEHDTAGRIIGLSLPRPHEEGFYVHRRYEYDLEGDLVRVGDSLNHAWSFEYMTHLMVRETDRTGLSFYFEYDGLGEDAWCTRTWGDGGIYDHVLKYDKQGHATYVTNSLGHTTRYQTNVAGLVTRVVDPLGGEVGYDYDPRSARPIAETDPCGHTRRHAYDARGNGVRTSFSDGTEIRANWRGATSLPSHVVDANGGEWHWHYDAAHQLVARVNPLGHATRYEWSRGLIKRVTSPGMVTLAFDHDDRGNVTRVTSPNGAVTRLSYDRLGRITEVVGPHGAVERRVYDTEAHLLSIEESHGVVRYFGYDSEGRVTRASDGLRHLSFTYVGKGRLQERSEAGATVRFSYDTEERLTGVFNEADELYQFARDAAGNVVGERAFDGSVRVFARDKGGRIVSVKRASGRHSDVHYDSAGRIRELSHSDGSFERYRYRGDGRLIQATNPEADVHLQRDLLGRIVRELTRLTDGSEWWVASRYGPDGHRLGLQTSEGHAHDIERTASGHARRVTTLDGQQWVDFERDFLGGELSRRFWNGSSMTWERDPVGRPVRRTVRNRMGAPVVQQEYDWRGDLRLCAVRDHAGHSQEFTHDHRGRLVRVRETPMHEQYRAMDSVGNVYRDPGMGDRRYSAGGRIMEANGTHYLHDADGHLVSCSRSDGAVTRYVWNDAGRLQTVQFADGRRVEFAYDALARRVEKRAYEAKSEQEQPARTTRWLWDRYFPLTTRDSRDGSTTWIPEPDTFNPLFKLAKGACWAVFSGVLGCASELASVDGRISESARLDIYGAMVGATSAAIPFGFPGQWRDEETGLAYNVIRYYCPELGRYISPDPLGVRAGLRAYGYVQSPVVQADPLGLIDPWDICFSQTSIGDTFLNGPWAGRTLEEAVAETRRLGALPEGLELNVMRLNDEWVTLNNRTLYVAQEANLPNVRVTDVGPGGMNQMNKLLDGGMPLPPGEQPEVRRSCG